MFVHIGGSNIIFCDELIGIFSSALIKNPNNKIFSKVIGDISPEQDDVSEKLKSLVVTDQKIYLSPISSLTISKRNNSII